MEINGVSDGNAAADSRETSNETRDMVAIGGNVVVVR
jgi:hypothetical protein